MSLLSRRPALAVGSLAVALTLAACGSPESGSDDAEEAGAGTENAADESAGEESGGEEVEVATLDPRIVLTYDGGVMTLDTGNGEVVDDVELEGYLRVNQAGDGRHVLVTTPDGFQAYDSGLSAVAHGDHYHYYESDPSLTNLVFPADHAGHVVTHDGVTALFADGTGEVTFFDPADLAEGEATDAGDLIADTWTAPEAHHGVAVPLHDRLVVTDGNEDSRSGVRLLDADREEVTATDDCPGVHGEAAAADDRVVFGCENGPVVLDGEEFVKVPVQDEYARSGNLFGTPDSPIVLGDYKVDADAELERPERIALIDSGDASLELVDLGASYSFRSLARGPEGEALVLTTDGALRVIDEETGEETASIPVVEEWEEPVEWQEARPAVRVADSIAYVTEPATDQVHAVDLSAGEVVQSYDLPHTPDELAVSTGFPPEEHGEDGGHEGHDHGEEGHEGHDHGEEDHAEEDHDH